MMRKTNMELAPYVAAVLQRDGIHFKKVDILQPNGGQDYAVFSANLPSRRFENVIEDAKCEMERLNSGIPDVPVLSGRAALNPSRMRDTLRKYDASCFRILKSDVEQFRAVTDTM